MQVLSSLVAAWCIAGAVALLPPKPALARPRRRAVSRAPMRVCMLKDSFDLVVIGGGTTAERRLTHVREYLREEGIGLEMMDTYNALNTFNILNAEGRQVAGALLTLQPREFYATVRDLS
mmetsp:Transcript_11528/g.40753  ORF Transcript_11528/g.40753 Transcript_11528/m.40753 type:complete len:120 (+) Transcript_11528:50-409(+)